MLSNTIKRTILYLPLFFFLSLIACATVPRERIFDDFIILKTEADDSLSSLAARYLGTHEKDWVIAEFNDIDTIRPGRELIIPLRPFEWGGLKANGYKTVPILTYFRFSKNQTSELTVSETAFRDQMKYLKENGYRVITLGNLLDFLDFKVQIPKKSVLITFDDGWGSLYDIAFPILRDYGFSATLFVYTDFIGGRKALTWEQINELAKNGFDIQCKTKTHRDLVKLNEGESFREYFKAVRNEISLSKQIIEQKLNKKCKYMAYPYGETNDLVIALVKREGYRAAFTAKRGSNPFFVNNYMINRSVIHGGFNIKQFKDNLDVFSTIRLK